MLYIIKHNKSILLKYIIKLLKYSIVLKQNFLPDKYIQIIIMYIVIYMKS